MSSIDAELYVYAHLAPGHHSNAELDELARLRVQLKQRMEQFRSALLSFVSTFAMLAGAELIAFNNVQHRFKLFLSNKLAQLKDLEAPGDEWELMQ